MRYRPGKTSVCHCPAKAASGRSGKMGKPVSLWPEGTARVVSAETAPSEYKQIREKQSGSCRSDDSE